MGELPDVDRAMRGDREAFGRLYARYSRAVFLDVVARVRGRQDAEDTLQAAFVAAWIHLPRLADPRRFVPWLFRIARNKARNLRRRERLGPVRLPPDAELVAPDAPEASDADLVRELLGRLRPGTRSIVFLRVLEGWSAEEVGAALGLSASTIRRRYAPALSRLREGLTRRTEDEDPPRVPRRAAHRAGL